MENSKGQTIFLSVIGVATLLVAIIGATFAWFSVTVTGNESANSIIVNTATLGAVQFEDTDAITLTNIKPIYESEITDANRKEFTIAQTDANATETLTYTISLEVSDAELTTVDEGYFKHSLSCTSNGSGTMVQFGFTEVPGEATNLLGQGTLVGAETHTYTYTIFFEESDSDQNAAQGASFAGKLKVDLLNAQVGGTSSSEAGA